MGLMILMVFLLTSVPWLAEAGVPDVWQTLTDAGTTARDQAQYEDAERLFLLARQETEQFEPGDRRVAATLIIWASSTMHKVSTPARSPTMSRRWLGGNRHSAPIMRMWAPH